MDYDTALGNGKETSEAPTFRKLTQKFLESTLRQATLLITNMVHSDIGIAWVNEFLVDAERWLGMYNEKLPCYAATCV